jgi:CheY-like chemotaxis protein
VEPLAPVDLRALMAELPALARHQEEQEPRPVGREIAFELQLEVVPPIVGNASELRQCLADLLGNAVDAMTQGGTICLRLQDRGDSIIATVQDSGRGMTEAEQTRCLEPFFTTKAAGAGLGLPLCAGIVARHRGRLSLSSIPGEGTACHLEFPVERTAASRPGGASAAYRILYIDDEPIVRRSMSMLLAALGHETDVAANGYAGIDQFKAQAYDVVISDFSMPGLTGRDVAAAIKALRPDTVVLLSTGWQTAQIAPALGEDAVEDGIIEKPVTIDTLKAALSRAMARRSTTRPG